VDKYEAVDARTFRIVLKEPYGLVVDSLGKPSSNVPFIMPKRVADTDPTKQIEEYVGSGPFVFQKDQWKPGERAVYTKFAKYKPRAEAPSGLAGGKVVKVDRVDFVILKDPQTMSNAIMAGEVDIVEQAAFEQIPTLRQNKDIQVMDWVGGGAYMCRPNHLVAPFNNEKVRSAAIAAMGNQEAFLRAQVGNKEFYKTCSSLYPCSSPYTSEKGMDYLKKYDIAKIRDQVKASGYDGSPIVIIAPTDLQTINKLPIVASQLLKAAGFNVDLQSMDWNSVVSRRAKRDPANAGGWNMFCTYWVAPDLYNPIASAPMGGQGEKGWFGWAKDDEIERLRDQFSRAGDEAEKKRLAEAIQVRGAQVGLFAPAGEAIFPAAIRTNVKGMVKAPVPVLWNVSK
jgi:peptide/nickel transport system substrate-binding protein